MRVFIDIGFITGNERKLVPWAKPVIRSILLQDHPSKYGIKEFDLELNGEPATESTEIHDRDRIRIIPKK